MTACLKNSTYQLAGNANLAWPLSFSFSFSFSLYQFLQVLPDQHRYPLMHSAPSAILQLAADHFWSLTGFVACATVCHAVWVVFYRLFLHPLADIPGPVLARAFYFYSFWHNLNGGRLYLHVNELHEQYGKCYFLWMPDEWQSS